MNTRDTLKRLVLGTFVLGMSGTIAFSAPSLQAHASALHPEAPEARQEAPETGPSAAEKGEKHRHKGFFLIEDAATIIGIDKGELLKQLESGKSIAEVAGAKGIQEADLTNRLLAIRMQKIDEAVKSGKWTQEKADRIKERLPDHLKMMVNNKNWKDWHKAKEHKGKEHKDKEHKGKEHKKAKETQADNEALPF
ncbi:hypothetical protein FE783_27290 [Paenibacillus mesophilus]|uniref:hypothetical protein n=1 Tax=Paenibacillus mesophilus TaxID=2582849 RepID=UPI00110F0645|nr:hypothetical protein [Paenibacillus mesophilus]TMV46128.1 hypothetical protein FE783_27290 [Paenibacillus mesophilus]